MRSFTIILDGESLGEPKRIQFDASDPGRAFDLLECEAIGRTAILLEGEKRLASLRRTQSGGWQLNS